MFDTVLTTIRKQGGYVPNMTAIITQTATEVATEILKQLFAGGGTAHPGAAGTAIGNTRPFGTGHSPKPPMQTGGFPPGTALPGGCNNRGDATGTSAEF